MTPPTLPPPTTPCSLLIDVGAASATIELPIRSRTLILSNNSLTDDVFFLLGGAGVVVTAPTTAVLGGMLLPAGGDITVDRGLSSHIATISAGAGHQISMVMI
jgi:hypothetical protein